MLTLKKESFNQIIGHCQDVYPQEACGILAGKDNKISKVYKTDNTSEDAVHCYFMDPKEQLKIFKEIRKDNLEMLAIYHSHSHSEAYPSSKDMELAFYPEASYAIVSLADKNNPVLRAFKIIEGKITEQKVQAV